MQVAFARSPYACLHNVLFFGLCTLAKPVLDRWLDVLLYIMQLSQRALGIDDRAQSESSTYKSTQRGHPVSPLLQNHCNQ